MSKLHSLSILSTCLIVGALTGHTPALAHGQNGGGQSYGMGQGMMHDDGHHDGEGHHDEHMGGGMGGHMGGGMGGGMGLGLGMGHGMGQARTAAYSLEEISVLMSAKLILMGNPRLTLGEVAAGDNETAVVEIVTQDGALVDRLAVDRWDLHVWRVE